MSTDLNYPSLVYTQRATKEKAKKNRHSERVSLVSCSTHSSLGFSHYTTVPIEGRNGGLLPPHDPSTEERQNGNYGAKLKNKINVTPLAFPPLGNTSTLEHRSKPVGCRRGSRWFTFDAINGRFVTNVIG